MQLPTLDNPSRYRGLYIFDFGEWTAVGYTAEEIAMLLESERFASGKVYKIDRVSPDGQMEIRGVSRERFQLESGMFFNRQDRAAAVEDFNALRALGIRLGLPCRGFVHLIDRGADAQRDRYATILIYPAEFEDEVARWLLAANFNGGDTVEGGPSHVTNYYESQVTILQREQLWNKPSIPARSPAEVFAAIKEPVQR